MAAEGGDIIVRFTYTGAGGEIIPDNASHVYVDVKIIPAYAFFQHPNIVEVICHDKVEKIELGVFYCCPRLRRVIMRGVKITEEGAFLDCTALTDVECGKLEIIGASAFGNCISLRSINLLSARILEEGAFCDCNALASAKFSNMLERFDGWAFSGCVSLERITIPLKDDMITNDDTFTGCIKLEHVDLVEGALLHETIVALQLEEWRNDMNEEIDSIHQILPNADAGGGILEVGEKALVMRRWLRSVLGKIVHCKEEHQRLLDEAVARLELALPRDITMNNVLCFLELPSHTFRLEDREDAEYDDSGNEEEAEEEEQYD